MQQMIIIHSEFFFYFLKIYLLFIFGCVGSVAARGLSLVAASRGYFSLQCTGFSLQWLLLLRSTGSRRMGFSSCGMWALERRLSSCGARAQLLRGMWDLPGPGIKPMSPVLAGGFLTTAPSGKSPPLVLTDVNIQLDFYVIKILYYSNLYLQVILSSCRRRKKRHTHMYLELNNLKSLALL